MARKDVDLVIRARDEAEKVVKSITRAVNDFTEAQAGLTAKAGKTENAMTALGAAFGQLERDLRGVSAADALAATLDKANKSVERLKASAADIQGEVDKLGKKFESSTAGVASLRGELAAAGSAMERGQSALKEYQKGLSGAEVEATKLAKAEKRLGVDSLIGKLEKQAAAVEKTEARIAQLRQEMSEVEKPTKRMTTSLETNTRKLEEQKTVYVDLSGQLNRARSELDTIARKMGETAQRIDEGTKAVQKQERVVDVLVENYNRIAKETGEAEKQNTAMAKSLATANRQLEREKQNLEKAEVELKQFAASSGEAEAAIRELSGLSIKGLEDDLQRQKRAVLTAKREYVELTEAATKLAGEMALFERPARVMVQQFDELKAKAGGAKQELAVQRETLELMGRAAHEAGTDLTALGAAQTRFVALQGQAGAQLQQIRSETEKAAASTRELGTEYRKLSNLPRPQPAATQQELSLTEQLSRAYRNLYGDKRRALSLTQRLRGEVLSLVAAYAGLYEAINILKETVEAYKTLEAAQARLNVAFDGNAEQVGYELDFLRRNAERLGVEFGSLAQEYSKFAIATKNTALEGATARKIFLQVTEAARVNRSSMQELRGVFTAVTQIVNKGAVQMEELRQQLGDRLPGAIQLMADGLGVTTAQLVEMMEQGEVTSEALIGFGNELEKRFGPQLADSLKSTSAEVGKLQNAAFQALLLFGRSGFIESFTEFARTLTETLQSADAQAFIQSLSTGFAGLLDVLGFAVENFQLIAAAAGAFVGVKLIPFVLALRSAFTKMGTAVTAANTQMRTANAVAAATGGSMGRAATAVRGLSVAFRSLLASTGIGLALVAVSSALAVWATEADKATEALAAHQKIVDQVKNAYDAAGGSVEGWRKKIEDLTITEARKNLRDLEAALESMKKEFDRANDLDGASFATTFFGKNILAGASKDYNAAIDDIIRKVKSGEINIKDLRDEVDAVNEQFNDGSAANARYAAALDAAAKKVVETYEKVEEAQKIVEALTGTEEEAQEALDDLAGSVENFGDAMARDAKKGAEEFNTALEELKELLPEANSELSELDRELVKIETSLQSALIAARSMPDAIMRIAAEQNALAVANQAVLSAAQQSIDGDYGKFTDGVKAATAFLRDVEGRLETPAYDVNAYRAGFGSDTYTNPDGTFRKIQQGEFVSLEAAIRDLDRRLQTEFIPMVRNSVGPEAFARLNAQQQAALTSIAYNYGRVPNSVSNAVRNGTTTDVVAAIRGLGARGLAGTEYERGARARTAKEASLYGSAAGDDARIAEIRKQQDELAKSEAKRAEERAKFHADQKASIEAAQFELSIADKELIAREQARAIREAELKAKEAGTTLSEEERQAILSTVAAKYQKQALEENEAKIKERAAKAEAEVNRLMEHRTTLQEQLKLAQDAGETERADELKVKIAEVNEQLQAAITNAQQMWAAVGGAASDTAITKLETAKIKAAEFGKEGEQSYFSWKRVGDLFFNGLTNAFDSFAQSVAEGKSIGEAARTAFLQFASDFLRQIAQMILKQALFNALSGTKLGGFLGIGTGHTGGLVGSKRVGSGNGTRRVHPGVFAGAARFHTGGIPGLGPNEIPVIAQKNEEILTRDDPRHILNGGGAGGGQAAAKPMTIINTFDAEEVVERALSTPRGEELLINAVRSKSTEIKAALG